MNAPEVNKSVQNLYSVSVRKLACVTVALPFFALFVCFITAYIFQFDDVHETHCRVFNVIPSISAVTGITPQTYLWRISVALHIGPRIIVAHLYRNYFSYLLSLDTAPTSVFKRVFVSSCFWFNIVELSSLCGVTYISNRENYPIHEKLFIVFMVCSLMFMLTMSLSYKMMHPTMTKVQNISYKVKLSLLITSLLSTVTLILFFMKHRFYCHDLAFTWFAFSEYVLASCNMAFHMTVTMDFPDERLMVASTFQSAKKLKNEFSEAESSINIL
ncbi:post-GPI attachment to proteins factor 2-like [Planococcus citri]|uniref:post-GPI attachment to proteins factor 2-like n=1 Tax=Planococcus citri TaxID=170843 RepID=UPI0031F88B69